MTEGPSETGSIQERATLGANYWRLWTSSVISNLGDGVTAIALPWLASAVTRSPILIALVAVAARIPWLVFTLPAGVITDRVDRRKLMWWSQTFRAVLMFAMAGVVLFYQDSLPSSSDVQNGVVSESVVVYSMIVLAALFLGFAEVLYDNTAQTILPAIVEPDGLERANSRLWGAEMVMNSFVGPPLGSVLIAFAFALPFFVDAGTFAVAAALIFFLVGSFKTAARSDAQAADSVDWWSEIKEGVQWLWRHPLLRPMAIILGLINGLSSVTVATLVLFAQESLGIDAIVFAVMGMAGALGGIVGSVSAPRVSKVLGSGPSLYVTLITSAVISFVIGFATHWSLVFVMFALLSFSGVLWNVITVSLRQTIIPDELLGRVNSVYRFFGWGMMPIGLAIGGILVAGMEAAGASRDTALRSPWWFAGVAFTILFIYAAPKLTTRKIETARIEGVAAKMVVSGQPDVGLTPEFFDG